VALKACGIEAGNTNNIREKVAIMLRGSREAEMKYTVIIEKGRESGYVAYAPALKGCVSQGKTKAAGN